MYVPTSIPHKSLILRKTAKKINRIEDVKKISHNNANKLLKISRKSLFYLNQNLGIFNIFS